jgi:hypothetical protein
VGGPPAARAGLNPRAGDDLLVVAAAGDNVLNSCAQPTDPAIDISPARTALLELKSRRRCSTT